MNNAVIVEPNRIGIILDGVTYMFLDDVSENIKFITNGESIHESEVPDLLAKIDGLPLFTIGLGPEEAIVRFYELIRNAPYVVKLNENVYDIKNTEIKRVDDATNIKSDKKEVVYNVKELLQRGYDVALSKGFINIMGPGFIIDAEMDSLDDLPFKLEIEKELLDIIENYNIEFRVIDTNGLRYKAILETTKSYILDNVEVVENVTKELSSDSADDLLKGVINVTRSNVCHCTPDNDNTINDF